MISCGVRGGAGPDHSWHERGRGSNKLNSIQDFVSCAQSLISDGLIHKDRLTALGMSAGCLLVGAAINMHPRLFRAAILKVRRLFISSRKLKLPSYVDINSLSSYTVL